MIAPGTVYLVGAGPGAPGLITVDGLRRLQQADVVVYDYLANVELLEEARPTAERRLVGKHGGGERVEQEVINALLIDRARQGKVVVRLKGGDPFVFGRGAEEAEALAAAGIPFEIVPGVTSAVAVPAYAGIPLTHRDHASYFTVLTGYEYPDKRELAIHWDAIARSGGTLVLLMATRQLRRTMLELIGHGRSRETPAAVIRWGTTAEQETIFGTIGTIADLAEAKRLQPPAIAVVGEVVGLRERLKWYERKPLFGRCVVVTRPRHQAADFIDRLRDAGADVVCCPSIEIVPPSSWEPVDAAIARLGEYDWVVFTSVNGVERFFERLTQRGCDVRSLHRARLAAVGPQTARALARRGFLIDVVPDEYRAEAVAAAIVKTGVAGAKVLLPRARGAREILPELLRETGAHIDEVHVYETAATSAETGNLRARLAERRVDMVTFTSSSTVRNFMASLGDEGAELVRDVAIGCIGPITADTAREFGLAVTLQPNEYTIAGLFEAILAHYKSARAKPKEDS